MTTIRTTEQAWQSQVIDLLKIHNWMHLHVRRSLGNRGGKRAWQTTTNIAGWPDIWAWHPTHGFLALELKSERGRVRPEQIEVLDQLRAAGAAAMVARPSDLDAVVALLRGEGS